MKEFYITMKDGTKVPITEEVYREYKRPSWREHKQRTVRSKFERSLDKFEEDNIPVYSDEVFEDIITDKILLETLLSALTSEEKNIIDEIYFNGKTEREVAETVKISQKNINKKKNLILQKMKNSLEI